MNGSAVDKNNKKMWIDMLYLDTQSQTWAGTTCRPLCLCPPTISYPLLSTVPCKYTPAPSDRIPQIWLKLILAPGSCTQ